MAGPTYAAASVRNADPILRVLRFELSERGRVFEIGSGTGYHAVHFASALPGIEWQCSDLAENHGLINAAIDDSNAGNVRRPFEFDVRDPADSNTRYDVVYTCNTSHIMDASAVARMFALVPDMLVAGGKLVCYGPFKRSGAFTTESNEAFDAALRARGGGMGLRDLEECDRIAKLGSLNLQRIYAMPNNNLLVIWQRGLSE